MNRTLIYLYLINTVFLATESSGQQNIHLIDLTQKIIKPLCQRPLPPRPAEETKFPELLTTLIPNNDWDTFSDPNIPERPRTPTPFTNPLSSVEEDEEGEDSIASTFHRHFNPISLSKPQSLTLPHLNFGVILNKELSIRERIIGKNWDILDQEEPIPLRVLMILRTSLNRQVLQEKRAEYKNMIDKKVQEHES